MWTKLGIASLCLAVIALAYPTLHGVIGLGYSDKLNVFPQSLIEILGAEWFLWINYIPFGFIRGPYCSFSNCHSSSFSLASVGSFS